jgi:sarcosine oxidase subunit alpha
LEKGHLIVGQDTDALTNPYEADVAWAIGHDKPFFVGGRSLEIVRQQTLHRKLIGIAFAKDKQGPLPEECHLIVHGGDIVGRITSIAHRSTLGYPVALAFVRPDLCEPGTNLTVRIDGNKLVQAKVSALPLYDPNNTHQQ